jgi:hypothetical protein
MGALVDELPTAVLTFEARLTVACISVFRRSGAPVVLSSRSRGKCLASTQRVGLRLVTQNYGPPAAFSNRYYFSRTTKIISK